MARCVNDGRREAAVRPLARLAGYLPIAVLARRNVSRATARSALAVVAVVIGVVAVGGVGLGGEAFTQNQLDAYEGFGGVATVSQFDIPDEPGEPDGTFSDEEIGRLRQTAGSAAVIPIVRPDNDTVRTPDGEALFTVQVRSMSDPSRFYELQSGSFPSSSSRAVVVGSRVASGNDIAVGDRVTVSTDSFTRSFRVAGILNGQGFSDPLSADRSVFVPVGQFDDPTYDEALVQADSRDGSLDETVETIEEEFNGRDRTVFVSRVSDQREQLESTFRQINRFLLGLGAVSLLVAAVTITNTMLMTIAEREGELGVLRAVGYGKWAVLRLIVVEATLLGAVGVAVGVPLTLGVGAVVNYALLGDPLAFTTTGLSYVALGAALGLGIALVGGVYPAWRAATRTPVEALD
jgi:putative ABC transport system permease protein